MQTKYEKLPFLPETVLRSICPGITILHPLSRRGEGPGMIVLVSETGVVSDTSLRIEKGAPSPIMKWAEEGYTVAEVTASALSEKQDCLAVALQELEKTKTISDKGVVGLVAYSSDIWNTAASQVSQQPQIVAASIYGSLDAKIASISIPVVHHLAGKLSGVPTRSKQLTQYDYPNQAASFATPFQPEFHYSSESVSHTRNLSFFKPIMNGPYFDLEAIWDEHTYYEFENRSVEMTMLTMVQEPYVNHVPTLTGGIGRESLTAFYRDHFIFQNSEDVEMELISRSVGIDRVVDEFIYKCSHDAPIDWLVPGIPPTHRRLEIPFTAVVNIRGDRLYHEHIAWDQATVLIQLGLMPEYLPYPQGIVNGHAAGKVSNGDVGAGEGKELEYRVPATGLDIARKLRDKDSVPSNEMFGFGVRGRE